MTSSLVTLAALASCAGHGGASRGDASTDGASDATMPTDGAADAGVDASAGSDWPAALMVGASSDNVTNAFSVTASGTAGSPYGALSFSGDVGTIDVGGGPAAGFVYATVVEGAYTLYDGFAVSPSAWDAFYLYCNGGKVVDVYDEKISGHGMVYAAVTGGSCSVVNSQTVAHVGLPAFSIPTPAPVGGYTVSGTGIEVAGDGNGTLTIGSTALPLVVFDTVDCSACGGAGWYELHSIVWDAMQQHAVFVIVYLINGMTSSVELAYARSLPDLGDPIGTVTRPATWTVAHVRGRPSATRGVPPPSMRLGSSQ